MKWLRWVVLAFVVVVHQLALWLAFGKVLVNVVGFVSWGIALLLTVGVDYARRKLQNKG